MVNDEEVHAQEEGITVLSIFWATRILLDDTDRLWAAVFYPCPRCEGQCGVKLCRWDRDQGWKPLIAFCKFEDTELSRVFDYLQLLR